MQDDPGIVQVKLAVGLTRPSMKWGVPYEAMTVNAIVSGLALIGSHNLLWFGVCLPIHAVCVLVCQKDQRTFELLALWCTTTLLTLLRTKRHWSAATYSPLAMPAAPGWIELLLIKRRQRLQYRLENHHEQQR